MLDRLFNWIDTSLAYRFSAALAYGSAVEVCLGFMLAAFSALEGFVHGFLAFTASVRTSSMRLAYSCGMNVPRMRTSYSSGFSQSWQRIEPLWFLFFLNATTAASWALTINSRWLSPIESSGMIKSKGLLISSPSVVRANHRTFSSSLRTLRSFSND